MTQLMTAESNTLSLHDALPICEAIRNPGKRVTHEVRFRHADGSWRIMEGVGVNRLDDPSVAAIVMNARDRSEEHTSELQSPMYLVCRPLLEKKNTVMSHVRLFY